MGKKKYVAYVGTYTHGTSKGIQVYDVDVENGTLTERSEVEVSNASHLAVSKNGKYLYSIEDEGVAVFESCLLYTSPSPRDRTRSRMPSSA